MHFKDSDIDIQDKDMRGLVYLLRKLQHILKISALDVEFAITEEKLVYILQVRPITRGCKRQLEELELEPILDIIYRKVEKLQRRHPFLLGETTYFGVSNKLKVLLEHGFNENQIKRIEYSLLDLTNDIINPKDGLYKQDIEKIHLLEDDYNKIMESKIFTVDKIYWLVEKCKQYGTLPFAGVARAAFIAVQFLKSFVDLWNY